jgi:hypothetical protein
MHATSLALTPYDSRLTELLRSSLFTKSKMIEWLGERKPRRV